MTWAVVIFSSNYPKQVIGPMSKTTAEALAIGISSFGAGGGNHAAALPLETP